MVIAKIILSQYQLVENLGVKVIEMSDEQGNIVFLAKDGDVICNKGTFNGIKVTGDSEFSGTMKGVSGSFKSLNCVDNSGKIVGNITFGSDGRMWFDGDMYSQGYNSEKSEATDFTQVTYFAVECLGTGKRLWPSSKVHICMCIQKERIRQERM